MALDKLDLQYNDISSSDFERNISKLLRKEFGNDFEFKYIWEWEIWPIWALKINWEIIRYYDINWNIILDVEKIYKFSWKRNKSSNHKSWFEKWIYLVWYTCEKDDRWEFQFQKINRVIWNDIPINKDSLEYFKFLQNVEFYMNHLIFNSYLESTSSKYKMEISYKSIETYFFPKYIKFEDAEKLLELKRINKTTFDKLVEYIWQNFYNQIKNWNYEKVGKWFTKADIDGYLKKGYVNKEQHDFWIRNLSYSSSKWQVIDSTIEILKTMIRTER